MERVIPMEEIRELSKDYLVSRVISFGKNVEGYSKVFYKTNEDLVDPYLDVDFKDKDVFSVLASSDHVFTARYLEAKSVDAFDFNRLTLYYFYLRLWSLRYRRELYPKIMDGDNEWLYYLLSWVQPRNKQETYAKNYFERHVHDNTEMDQLFYDVEAQPEGRTLFTKPEELSGCLSPDLTFYPINLLEEFHLPKQYDIGLVSNILDTSKVTPEKLQIAYENLDRLIRPGGSVICSKLHYRTPEEMEIEKRIFEKSFEFIPKEEGYVYQKKN